MVPYPWTATSAIVLPDDSNGGLSQMSLMDVGSVPARPVVVAVAESLALVGDAVVSALGASGLLARHVPVDSCLDGVDVVLADARLHNDDLARLASEVARRPECQLVLVSMQNTKATQQIMRQVGAVTTFERTRDVTELVSTVMDVARHDVRPPRAAEVDQDGPRALTTRELQILEIIAAGATNADVANQLSISPHTVRSHLANILTKLGVAGRLSAVTAARQAGVLPGPRSAR
jgi:DNA-binding NarL/FixJ family response regulator